jgi:hypothetical protein
MKRIAMPIDIKELDKPDARVTSRAASSSIVDPRGDAAKAEAMFLDPAEPPSPIVDVGWHFDWDAGARLHLQSSTSSHRVWLERDGHRTFEPEAALEMKVFERLEVLVSRPVLRCVIEQAWIARMIREGWLELEWVSERSFVLCAYPGRVGAFRRHVELRPAARAGADSPGLRPLYPEDVRLCGRGALQLWEHEIPLSAVLWGQRDSMRRLNVRCQATCCRGSWNEAADGWAVTCSEGACEVPACSARADGTGERSSELRRREDLEYATANVLRRALLLHYRAALRAKHAVALSATDSGEQHAERRLTRLLETELVPLVARYEDPNDGRRAYAEVFRSLSLDDGAGIREEVECLVLLDLERPKLSHSLDRQDTLAFWRKVNDLLGREWTKRCARAKRTDLRAGSAPSRRARARYLPGADTVILLRDVAGHDWGWLSCDDHRMHLQTLERGRLSGPNEIRVWLEDRGVRAFVLGRGALSQGELDELGAAVNGYRPNLEARWVCLMANQQRLCATLSGSVITFTAYSGSPRQFTRRLDLRSHFGGAYSGSNAWDENPPRLDWDPSNGLLAVGHEENIDHRCHIDVDCLFED